MGESWFHREFLVARRLAFNVLFYGIHFFLFGYGWHSQVRLISVCLTFLFSLLKISAN
jgi:hypothetical protein